MKPRQSQDNRMIAQLCDFQGEILSPKSEAHFQRDVGYVFDEAVRGRTTVKHGEQFGRVIGAKRELIL